MESSLKRVRSESELDSPEAKRIQHDLLDTSLEDTDECTLGQDLESFIKSFQDEISPPATTYDSRPNLEFLLEASDDELGLPPTETETESGVFSWLDEQLPNYESFDYDAYANSNNGEYLVALDDGLFENTDVGFGSSESLPAQ